MEEKTNGGSGLIVMAGGAIIYQFHAPTGAQSSSFQAEKTAMQAAFACLEEYEDWHKTLFICHCQSLIDSVSNLLAPDDSIMLVQAAVARLNSEGCLEVLWVPGHCGLQGNEVPQHDSAEHQPPLRLNYATGRSVIRRARSTPFISCCST